MDENVKANLPRIADNINELVTLCHSNAAISGWWIDTETGEDVRNWPPKFFKLWVATKLMLTVSEVAESMEGHRKNLMDDHLPHLPMFLVELGDAMIRICDLVGGVYETSKCSLGSAVVEKLVYNSERADHKVENRIAEGGKSY